MKTKFGNAKIYDGYYRITSTKESNNGKYLHRLVWEDYHGKPVPDGYVIHHRNGVKTDNRIQNLECVKLSKHSTFHNNTTGYYRVYEERCESYKQGFKLRYVVWENGKRKQQFVAPTLEKLEEKVKAEGLPWYKLENINTSTL